MKRLLIGGVVLVVVLAVGVYRAKLGAEDTQAHIDELNTDIKKVQGQISVLKAEETYLSRPDRIGPIARDRLGLELAKPEQYSAGEMLPRRLGEERIPLPQAPVAAPIVAPKIVTPKSAKPATPAVTPASADPQPPKVEAP